MADSNLPSLVSRTLTGVKLSPVQMKAINLLINRDANTTLSDIASSLDISLDTLNSYLRDPKFANELQAKSDLELYANIGYRPKVVQQLMNIAFADPREMYDADGGFLHIKDLPKHVSSIISEFTVTQIGDTARVTKVKLESKTKSLQLLAQHFGLIKNQVDMNLTGSLKVETSMAPIDSIPRWLQMVLLATLSGKEISPELQGRLLREVEGSFDAEYNVIDTSEVIETERLITEGSEPKDDFILVTEFQ